MPACRGATASPQRRRRWRSSRWRSTRSCTRSRRFAGEQTEADASAVELWADATLVIVCVRFRGAPLPDWLLANWDRAHEPAVLAPGTDSGWGWLLVREALDAVSHAWRGREQLLFLEKRL